MTIYTVDSQPPAVPWKSPLLPPVEVMRFLDDLSSIPGVSAAYTMRGRTEAGYTITIDIQLDNQQRGSHVDQIDQG